MASRLSRRVAAAGSRRRDHARGVSHAGGDRRRLARGPSARGRSVRMPVFRPGLLAVLQLEAHGHHRHVRAVAADRCIGRRIERRRSRASCGDGGRRGAAGGRASRVRAWLVRAGAVVSFFSETVLVGFKSGLALYLASTQLPKLFGIKGTHGDFFERSGYFLSHLGDTQQASLLVGAVALALLVAGKLWLKNRPVALLRRGGGMRRGAISGPRVAWSGAVGRGPAGACRRWGCQTSADTELNALLPIAMAGFVLGAVETSAIGRMFAPEARKSTRRESGVSGARRGQSCRRPRARLSGERRHVAVARQRKRRGAHADLGSHRCGVHAHRRAVCVRAAAQSAAARAGGDRAHGRHGPRRHPRLPSHMEIQSRRVPGSGRGARSAYSRPGP